MATTRAGVYVGEWPYSVGMKIEVAESADALSHEVAEQFVRLTTDAVQTRGRCTVALSGGSSPGGVYQLLGAPAFRTRVRWNDIHFFWGDERHVPPDHPDSNYRMAVEAMLSKVPVPPANVHRVRSELPDAERAAREYEETILACVNGEPPPRFDLIHLGIGTDGHVASLFPGSAALEERQRICVANWVAKFDGYRITVTLPVLNAARAVVFIATGVEKAAIVQQVLRDPVSSPLPAQLVQPADGELSWMLDRAAAGEQT
jgi:6-phosphogluconolactonase